MSTPMLENKIQLVQFQVICEQTILSPQHVGINRVRKNFELKISAENYDSEQ